MAWGEQGNKITWNANIVPESQRQHGGWYDNPDTGFNQRWYTGSVPTSPNGSQAFSEPSIDWDAIYNPQFQALSSAEQQAKEGAVSLEGDVNTIKDATIKRLAGEEELANEKFALTEKKTENNKNSALDKAVRDYQALQQQGSVRFGAGSSAGRAMGEIAQREYFRNQGQVEQSYADIFGDIEQQKKATMLTFLNAREENELWAKTEISKIKRQLSDQLESIKQTRFQVEANKTAKRMEALQQAFQEAKAIQLQKQQNEDAFNMWKQQQDYLIANKLVPQYNSYNPNTQGYTPTQTNVSASTSNVQGGGEQKLLNLRWNPNSKSFFNEDENRALV